MSLDITHLKNNVEQCLLSKLTRNVEESNDHEEYESRKLRFDQYFDLVLNALGGTNIRENLESAMGTLPPVYILYKELWTEGPWHTEKFEECAKKLNTVCEVLYEVSLASLLKTEHSFNNQRIFDECMLELHRKLTSEDFKKLPSLVEVYCSMIKEIEEYKNVTVDVKVLPVSLYLIDDYVATNKIKGLICCKNILKHLTPKAFIGGNYYEVIYTSLKKASTERDIEITRLVIKCLIELFNTLPSDVFKLSASYELYTNTLDQIQIESNLHRKAALFNFTKQLIEIIGVNSVSRKSFHNVVCDNLDISCNDGVEEMLLLPVIECLEEWIKHCWCAWRLCTGELMLSRLFKVLYTCSNESTAERIITLIATLLSLCAKEDKEKILNELQKYQIKNEKFQKRVDLVKKHVIVN